MLNSKDLHTNFIGHKILYFNSLTSTNDKCKEIHTLYPSGTVVISDIQTKGRGKNSRQWYSPYGGIYLSILLKDLNITINDLNKIPLIASLAICKSLNSLKINSSIKWPNDIILENKKLGGILCESKFKGSHINYIIVGIGLNVNSILNNSSLDRIFTSLTSQFNQKFDKDFIIKVILNKFESVLYDLINGDFQNCLNLYKKYCLILNKTVKLLKDSEEEIVQVIDINDNGSLKVIDSNNCKRNIFSGDISIRGISGYI